jgi:hypothetical protein
MAAAVDYKQQEIAKTEVKPFTNEELLAMINSQSASVKQKFAAAKAACASADAEAKIKFDDDKRIGFASCKAITMSATK